MCVDVREIGLHLRVQACSPKRVRNRISAVSSTCCWVKIRTRFGVRVCAWRNHYKQKAVSGWLVDYGNPFLTDFVQGHGGGQLRHEIDFCWLPRVV